MKVILTEQYAKTSGVTAMCYHEDCKVARNKIEPLKIDVVEVEYNGEVIQSFDNKIVKEIVFDE